MKIKYCVFFSLILIFSGLFLGSCDFNALESESKKPVEASSDSVKEYEVTGCLSFSGAVPSDLTDFGASRYALPADNSTLCKFRAVAVHGTGDSKIEKISDWFGVNDKFSLKLLSDGTYEYDIIIEGYGSETSTDKLLLTGAYKDLLVNGNVDLPSKIFVYPDSASGTGAVSLKVGIDTGVSVTKIQASWYEGADKKTWATEDGATLTEVMFNMSSDSVNAGNYTVNFKFFNGEFCVYSCIQKVNVFANYTTTVWIGDCFEYIKDNGTVNSKLLITQECISHYTQKNYYVDSSSEDGNGTFLKPFKTVQQAVNVICSVNDGGNYTIFLLSDIVAGTGDSAAEGFTKNDTEGDSLIYINPGKTLNLFIETLDKSNKVINANRSEGHPGRVLYVGDYANVTLKDVTVKGGYLVARSGAGIYSYNGTVNLLNNVSVTENNITSSSSSSNTYGAGIYLYKSVLNMLQDCYISKNNCYNYAKGGGVCVFNSDALIQGGEIFDNTVEMDNGGGVYVSKSLPTYSSSLTISNCKIYNNNAVKGSGVFNYGCKVTLGDGAYIYNNGATEGSDCSGVYITNSYTITPEFAMGGSAYVSPENSITLVNTKASSGISVGQNAKINISEKLTSTYAARMKVSVEGNYSNAVVYSADTEENYNSARERFDVDEENVLFYENNNTLWITGLKNIYVRGTNPKVLSGSESTGEFKKPFTSIQDAVNLAESYYTFETENSVPHNVYYIVMDGTFANSTAKQSSDYYSYIIAGKTNTCNVYFKGYSEAAPAVISNTDNTVSRNIYIKSNSSVTLGENLTLEKAFLSKDYNNVQYGKSVFVEAGSSLTLADNIKIDSNVHLAGNSVKLSSLTGTDRLRISLGDYTIGSTVVTSGASAANCSKIDIYNGYGDKKSDGLYLENDGKLTGYADSVYSDRKTLGDLRCGTAAAGKEVYFGVIEFDSERWYESDNGVDWTEITAYKNDYKCKVTVPAAGSVKYIKQTFVNDFGIEESGTTAKIECNANYDVIGNIYYSDKTFSRDLDSAKTAVGIVVDTDSAGKPSKIIHLYKAQLQWATEESAAMTGEGIHFEGTSQNDGALNWDIIKNYIGNDTSKGNYPAFDYCESYASASWYVPANDELEQLAANLNAVNSGLQKIGNVGYIQLSNNCYCLSSQSYSKKHCYVKPLNSHITFDVYKSSGKYVIPFAKVETVNGLASVQAMEYTTFASSHKKDDGSVDYDNIPNEFTSADTAPTLLIYTAEELRGLSKWTEKATKMVYANIILKDDIDLGGVPGNADTYFTPICFAYPLSGIFDGQGHTVDNMIVYADNSHYAGFIGSIKGASVKNIKLKGEVHGQKQGTGGIVGLNTGMSSTITDCVNYAKVTSEAACTGGILGYAAYHVDIRNCINIGEINGNATVGGISTNNSSTLVIMNCANIGNVNANSYVGGIAPDVQCIKNCYNAGKVTSASGDNTGGSILYSVSNISEEKYYLKCYYLKDSYIYKGNNYAISAGTNGKDLWLLTGMFDTELKLEGDTTSLRDALNTGIASFATEEYKTPWDYTYSKDGVAYPVCVPVE